MFAIYTYRMRTMEEQKNQPSDQPTEDDAKAEPEQKQKKAKKKDDENQEMKKNTHTQKQYTNSFQAKSKANPMISFPKMRKCWMMRNIKMCVRAIAMLLQSVKLYLRKRDYSYRY